LINDALTLDFIIDSGASDVSIPADVVQTLMRKGSVREEDFLSSGIYQLADGSMVPSERFTIRTIKVGEIEIENVTATLLRLLGLCFLDRAFNSLQIVVHRQRPWRIVAELVVRSDRRGAALASEWKPTK
jgi:predicted aspartyl protease